MKLLITGESRFIGAHLRGRLTVADIRIAKSRGLAPKTSLEKGLKETIGWFRNARLHRGRYSR